MYAWTSLVLSILAVILAVVYAWRVARAYRRYHDERAAVSLAKAIGLAVIALGTFISAIGLLVAHGPLSSMGLAIARGALIATLATLVLADVRPGDTE